MRSLFHFRWLAALVCWFGTALLAHGTHILGGEVTYSPIASTTPGVPRYHIVAKMFRDVTKIDQPIQTLTFSPGDCSGSLPGSFLLQVPVTSVQRAYSLGCPTAPVVLYEVKVYEVDVDLPANRWTISAVAENRSDDIRNIPNSINTAYSISTVLDNTFFTQNSSPKFQSTL